MDADEIRSRWVWLAGFQYGSTGWSQGVYIGRIGNSRFHPSLLRVPHHCSFERFMLRLSIYFPKSSAIFYLFSKPLHDSWVFILMTSWPVRTLRSPVSYESKFEPPFPLSKYFPGDLSFAYSMLSDSLIWVIWGPVSFFSLIALAGRRDVGGFFPVVFVRKIAGRGNGNLSSHRGIYICHCETIYRSRTAGIFCYSIIIFG